MDMERRDFIKQLAFILGAGLYAGTMGASSYSWAQEGLIGLADQARMKGIAFGSCVKPDLLKKNAQYRAAIKKECSLLVAESHMKWNYLNPAPDVYKTDLAEQLVRFADVNNMHSRFHTIIWHNALPDWVKKRLQDEKSARLLLHDYATHVLSRFNGRIRSWDIVNEVIRPHHGNPKGMTSSPWYKAMGQDYVAECFNLAKSYGLKGDFVLNETSLYAGDENSARQRYHLLNLVRDLKDRDIPVDAVGLQSHLKLHRPLADEETHLKWLSDLKETGVKILITELDINDKKIEGSKEYRAKKGAQYAQEYLKRIFSVTNPDEITLWGIWDKSSWLNVWRKTVLTKKGSPTLYDDHWHKNPFYDTLSGVLERL